MGPRDFYMDYSLKILIYYYLLKFQIIIMNNNLHENEKIGSGKDLSFCSW